MARTLMIQGTTSDAGKSTLVAGLCRLYARRGIAVAPFKPQNMALNSAVTVNGGEIGRAQAVQALAAGLEPHTDFNPILLKPSSDTGAQVIVNGQVIGDYDARAYHDYKPLAMQTVLDAHARLRAQYRLVLVEGAGSPAEINLRAGDVANMGFAEAVDCPVILVADIDRGGVFAHIVGTLELLSPTERARIRGFVINRFRGDIALLEPGLRWLERHTGKPVLGVVPHLHDLYLEAEDALPRIDHRSHKPQLRIVAPVYPRISNHTDLDALRLRGDIDLRLVANGTPPAADLVILPGSKNVRADLDWLRRAGWEAYLQRHLRYGGKLIGLCGGFQMLGSRLHDPLGLEGDPGSSTGLGLLALETELKPGKQLRIETGRLHIGGARVSGYEIHMGVSSGPALARPALELDGRAEGALSPDGNILGTYLHGLFDAPEAAQALLAWAGYAAAPAFDHARYRDAGIERLADALEAQLDMDFIDRLCLP